MGDRSAIEWTHSTFNPWVGCTKVSPACENCYAEISTPSRTRGVLWGAGKPRQRTSAGNWKRPLQWNAEPFYTCGCGYSGTFHEMTTNAVHACDLKFRRVRRRVFCASLADVFDNEVPAQWRADLFALIHATPNLDWLLLTKRIGNATAMMNAAAGSVMDDFCGAPTWERSPWPNVWLGATICNQVEADRDVPKLLTVPAAVRFLSIEPMLGSIDLSEWLWPIESCTDCPCPDPSLSLRGLEACCKDPGIGPCMVDWVIAGGESGPNARPMHPEWVRSVRDQCFDAAVPFLFKQWGEWAPRAGALFGSGEDYQSTDPQCKRWPSVIRLGEHGRNTQICENCTPDMGEDVFMQKVGKKNAGRQIDGLTHDGYPEVRSALN